MTRLTLVIVMVVALAAASWWSFGGAGGPERVPTHAEGVARSKESAEVELAASANAARSDGRAVVVGDAPEPHATSNESVVAAPDSASALPCGVRVVRGDAPVAGASVELERVADGEVLRLVTDGHGFAAVEEGTFERGPWLALAGHAGMCNRGLRPVEIGTDLRQPEVLLDHTSHLALKFVRSDGAPVILRDGESAAVESDVLYGASCVSLSKLDSASARRALTCLELAGLHDHGRVDEQLVWQSQTDQPPTVGIKGVFRQIDATSARVALSSVPVAAGGTSALVEFVVDPAIQLTTVVIDCFNPPAGDAIERCARANVVFVAANGESIVRTLVLSHGARIAIPAGVWDAQLVFDGFPHFKDVPTALSTAPIRCELGAAHENHVRFDLSEFGAIEIEGDFPWLDTRRAVLGLTTLSDLTATATVVAVDRPLALVMRGSYLVRYAARSKGLCVNSDVLRDSVLPAQYSELLDDPATLVERVQELLLTDPHAHGPLAEYVRVDVTAGAVTLVRALRP